MDESTSTITSHNARNLPEDEVGAPPVKQVVLKALEIVEVSLFAITGDGGEGLSIMHSLHAQQDLIARSLTRSPTIRSSYLEVAVVLAEVL